MKTKMVWHGDLGENASALWDIGALFGGYSIYVTGRDMHVSRNSSSLLLDSFMREWKINWLATADDCGKFESKKQWRKNK